jgi:foldase protein PrsA
MVDEAAKKAGVTATQKEIDAKMDEAVKKMGAPNADALLRQYNVTKQRVLDGNRLNVLVEKVVRKQVGASSFDLTGWVKARHILVKFVQTETDAAKKDADARKKIDEIALKVKDGDFEKLAKEFSEDEGSKASGGDLGWFGRGRMLKEFEDAVFGLKPGQVSDPVKTFYGYHIIKLEKTGKDATVAEKNDLMKTVVDGKVQEEMTKWFANLASNTKSDNYLVDKTPATPFGPQMGPRPMPKQGSPNPGGSRPAPPAEKPQPAVPEAPPPPPSQ